MTAITIKDCAVTIIEQYYDHINATKDLDIRVQWVPKASYFDMKIAVSGAPTICKSITVKRQDFTREYLTRAIEKHAGEFLRELNLKKKYERCDALDALTYAIQIKNELEKLEKGEKTMNKKTNQSICDIQLEKEIADKRREAAQKIDDIQTSLASEIEENRIKCERDKYCEQAEDLAWKFGVNFEALKRHGFTDEQAMQIILATMKN